LKKKIDSLGKIWLFLCLYLFLRVAKKLEDDSFEEAAEFVLNSTKFKHYDDVLRTPFRAHSANFTNSNSATTSTVAVISSPLDDVVSPNPPMQSKSKSRNHRNDDASESDSDEGVSGSMAADSDSDEESESDDTSYSEYEDDGSEDEEWNKKTAKKEKSESPSNDNTVNISKVSPVPPPTTKPTSNIATQSATAGHATTSNKPTSNSKPATSSTIASNNTRIVNTNNRSSLSHQSKNSPTFHPDSKPAQKPKPNEPVISSTNRSKAMQMINSSNKSSANKVNSAESNNSIQPPKPHPHSHPSTLSSNPHSISSHSTHPGAAKGFKNIMMPRSLQPQHSSTSFQQQPISRSTHQPQAIRPPDHQIQKSTEAMKDRKVQAQKPTLTSKPTSQPQPKVTTEAPKTENIQTSQAIPTEKENIQPMVCRQEA
jgi:hypothetical protein